MSSAAETRAAATATVIDDLELEHRAIERLVAGAELDAGTLATGWTVRDTIEHLLISDWLALLAVADPVVFASDRGRRAGSWAAVATAFNSEELRRAWSVGHDSLIGGLRKADPDRRVGWMGPSMSLRSFATARIMENWAHAEDIAQAVGAVYPATGGLRQICHLGVLTRTFSFTVRGEPAPEAPMRVELDLPGGTTWQAGDPGAENRVSGPARDFCLVVTQRRHVEDTSLSVHGDAAVAWMHCAQVFAGAPTSTAESRRGVPA
jgi:uncharacterized protein (TIGR03084 family)